MKGKIYWVYNHGNQSNITIPDLEVGTITITNVETRKEINTRRELIAAKIFAPLSKREYKLILTNDGNNLFVHKAHVFTAKCSIFQNDTDFVIYGEWVEQGIVFAWWAIFD